MTQVQFNSIEEELIFTIIKEKEMQEQYGHISCFDAPKEYTEMDLLNNRIRQLVMEISQSTSSTSHPVSDHAVFKIYESIVKDAREINHMTAENFLKGIEEGAIQFNTLDFDEFMKTYVLKESENELFTELFQFVDIHTQVDFIKDRFLVDLDIYYSRMLDYLVHFEVDEEALENLN